VSYGDRGGAEHDYLKFTITGADLKLKTGTRGSYTGTSTSNTLTLAGEMSVARAPGHVSFTTMSAQLGSKRWVWPSAGEDNRIEGRTVSKSFSLTYKVGSSDTYVTAAVILQNCGGICAAAAYDFMITVKKPSSPPTGKPSSPPVVRAYPLKQVLKPATYGWLPYSVKDASGKAKVHGTLYEGGTPLLEGGTRTFIAADGRLWRWKARLAADLKGPLYFCLWAENRDGQKSVKAPKSSCAWLSLLVDIDRVSNTCGGEGWDSVVWIENSFGNTSRFYDPDTRKYYNVNFAAACNLHDAGYGGYTVKDEINGGIVDYHNWSRERVDVKFQKDMQALCRKQIPAAAKRALLRCLGGDVRFQIVRKVGNNFFDADLMKPGLQKEGPRDNS